MCAQSVVAAQAPIEHPPCVSIEGTVLSDLEGLWDVNWSYRVSPGEFIESQAHSTFTAELAGCALIERFEGTLRGQPFSSITLFSWQTEERLERVRLDSEHGAHSYSVGSVRSDTLVFEAERDLGQRVLRTRHLFYNVTSSSFDVEFYMSRSLDSPWELVESAVYMRHSERD